MAAMSTGAGAQETAFLASHTAALAGLWRGQLLCDVALRGTDGQRLVAHRVVLAAASGFFRALFCGAGCSMREGAAAAAATAAGSASAQQQQQPGGAAIDLPFTGQQLAVLLTVLYDHRLEVCAANVAWLLDMSCYLEVPPLQEACCEFLRGALAPDSCVDVLQLAHQYHCTAVTDAAVLYLAQRLPSLLLVPEVRRGLARLPEPLLVSLLSSEALEADQEAELLCLLAEWVTLAPGERLPALPRLLALLQLSALPDSPLSQQQLSSCASAEAAQLALQLQHAAQQCQRQQGTQPRGDCQQQQQQQQHGEQVGQQQPVSSWASAALPPQHAIERCRDSSGSHSVHSASGDAPAASGPIAPQPGPPGSPAADEAGGAARLEPSAAGPSSWCGEPGLQRVGCVLLDAWPGRQRGFKATMLLVAGGHDPSWRGLKSVELYDPRSGAWRPGPALPAALPFAAAGLPMRGQLYVVGGGMYSSHVARLDVGAEEWSCCEGPRLSRLHAAVAGTAGLLYVTGGRTQVNQVLSAVEVLEPSAGRWQVLPDMQQPRYAHAAATLGGCIYVAGGQASKAIHRTVEVFDAHRGSWQLLGAQLGSERKYCAAAPLGGRLLVVGGMTEARCRLASVEAYDAREGRWTALASMQHARSSCGVASLCGRLYAVGGNAGDQQLHGSVEEYDPAAGRWRSCAPLACGRSGLTAVAV